jgi:hypothetical protein
MSYCTYCEERPVKAGWLHTCSECTYICGTCKAVTPYESGGDDPDCDECWASKN